AGNQRRFGRDLRPPGADSPRGPRSPGGPARPAPAGDARLRRVSPRPAPARPGGPVRRRAGGPAGGGAADGRLPGEPADAVPRLAAQEDVRAAAEPPPRPPDAGAALGEPGNGLARSVVAPPGPAAARGGALAQPAPGGPRAGPEAQPRRGLPGRRGPGDPGDAARRGPPLPGDRLPARHRAGRRPQALRPGPDPPAKTADRGRS